ncbi:50S ribosomal protein L3, chloroplastic [Phalaenopsis equestris]|uniref:50S ribosomal protein L3, chloroplastic n=1 Tax=Phalaenopsis equestris TaxID=78828 RepID=UPI0009E50DC7|nr:50S ribosomal protein L3, chloroplastic [Phalaenopsis equestris]
MAATAPIAGACCTSSPSPTQMRRLSRQTLLSLSSSFTKSLHFNSSSSPNSFHSLTRRTRAGSAVAPTMSMEAGIGVMGTKLGMMSYFEPEGTVVPVTVVGFREGNIVTQIKTTATEGYDAVQVGYRRVRDRKLTRPELGHLSKAGAIPMRHLQEFRLTSIEGFEPGQRLVIDEIFKEGDLVDVSGTTIGKGFQGGIKRHNFRRGPMTHGSKSHRALGSIGAGTTPGRVYKGKKMPGRMGGTKRKIRKLKIVKIDNELRVVMIKGAVPGKPGNLLRITPAKIVGKNIPKS